jgi:polyphosphate kinase 2 (PPK2 family)
MHVKFSLDEVKSMSISKMGGGGHDPARISSRRVRSESGAPTDPIDRVDRLITDLETGKVRYRADIAAKIRPKTLTLGNYPCQKYLLKPSQNPIDSRELPTEIVADGEKPRYRGSITQSSKLSEKETAKDLEARVESIHDRMNALSVQRQESLMVLLEGDNAAGKDGMIKHVFTLNPMTTRGQVAFKGASAEEREHEPNWRIMKNLAGPGQIMFHNRSHYGDVVFAAKTPHEKAQRLADIKELEYGLTMGLPMTAEGHIALPDKIGNIDPSAIQRPPMRFIKVLVGVSKEEQALRLAERLTDDSKLYKITQADLDGHEHHDTIQSDFANAMAAVSTPWAPAYYLPNDTKLTGWRKMAEITDEVLADMDPQVPGSKEDMSLKTRQAAAKKLLEEAHRKLRK